MADIKPLVLDVDGTFLRTDLLFESLWAALGRAPMQTLRTCFRNFRKPALLKRELAALAGLQLGLMPVNSDLAVLVAANRSGGREVVLASAADSSLVSELARLHRLSPRVFASDGETNLKGSAKAQALSEAFGAGGFDYAGDARVDRLVWEQADNALIVGHRPRIAAALTGQGKNVVEYAGGWRMTDLLRGIRPHQWVKNLLLLLPMVAAHDFSLATVWLIVQGMIAFSAAASAIYIVNDLLDLEADRLHPTKKDRPFASGAVPIVVGMVTSGLLALVALGLGALLGPAFLGVVMLYMALSLAYSLRLKRMRWVDIATLASLYTLRVVAGAAAGQVLVTGYMLVFIFPVFVTLGSVKRLTELTLATTDDRLPGRGYGRTDRGDLLNVAGLGTVGALTIFFLYTLTSQAISLYPTRWLLWVAMLPMAGWLVRMVRLGYFGKQDYDPIVFAMRDKRGLGLLLLILSIMFYAAGLWQHWFGF